MCTRCVTMAILLEHAYFVTKCHTTGTYIVSCSEQMFDKAYLQGINQLSLLQYARSKIELIYIQTRVKS